MSQVQEKDRPGEGAGEGAGLLSKLPADDLISIPAPDETYC